MSVSSAPSPSDDQLLASVRSGDARAAAALYDRLRPQVYRTIRRLLGRTDNDEDDLAQVSIMETFSSLRRFRGECALDTWTARITARAVFKELSRRRAERSVFSRSSGEVDTAEDQVNAEQRATMRNVIARIRDHLGALDSAKGWTLLLHDVCGYDLKEISVITNASVAAAQSRLVRGRAELEVRLEHDSELASWLRRKGATL